MEHTGDDLLSVFNDLNVQLGDVSPNVVRAWFDTDDKAMKEMLNWMCSSLSKKNHVNAQEHLEYQDIAEPLSDAKYEKELMNIQNTYPGLFDIEYNLTEIEFLEEEYELLKEEDANCDKFLKMQQDIKSNLTLELSEANANFIQSTLQLRKSQEKCNECSEKLDSLNKDVFQQVERYGKNLREFKFSNNPNFLNRMDLNNLQESIDNLTLYLNVLLKNPLLNSTNFTNLTIAEDEITNGLSDIETRIYLLHQEYLANKFEKVKQDAILSYLLKLEGENILHLSESAYLQANIDAKIENKNMMYKMMENVSNKYASMYVNQPKLRYQQQELTNWEQRLVKINKVLTCIYELYSYYIVIHNLFKLEGKDIQEIERFFKNILEYNLRDLQMCTTRTDKMNTLIEGHNEYINKPLDEKFKLVQSIGKLLSSKETSLSSICQTINDFKRELNNLEHKVFAKDFEEHCQYSRELDRNMDILQQFLAFGPTHRMVGISPELYGAIKEVNSLVKNQTTSVQNATQLSSKIKKDQNDKWKNHLRQLWMYFLKDNTKLLLLMKELEAEPKNTE